MRHDLYQDFRFCIIAEAGVVPLFKLQRPGAVDLVSGVKVVRADQGRQFGGGAADQQQRVGEERFADGF